MTQTLSNFYIVNNPTIIIIINLILLLSAQSWFCGF